MAIQRDVSGFVDRLIDEAEAAIVRQICRLYSGGDGLTRIAKQLDADGVPAPRKPSASSRLVRRQPRSPPKPVCPRWGIRSPIPRLALPLKRVNF